MSFPTNPLSEFGSYEVKHVLLAFTSSEAACEYQPEEHGIGKVGTYLPAAVAGCGKACVLINEVEDQVFFLNKLRWSFDFYSPLAPTTTACTGEFTVVSQQSLIFPNFIRKVAKEMGMSVYHITFVMFSFFKGTKNGEMHTIVPKPLIFNVIDSHSALDEAVPSCHTFNFVAQYNTLGQLPQFSALNQTTITHQDGSLGQSLPVFDGTTSGINSRKAENAAKNRARKMRLDKSKPMRSLRELANGLQQELKDQTQPNKRQLQEFLSSVRDDFVKKIQSPQQKKDKNGGITIDYTVSLDPYYNNMSVDNRNLPFEQPDQGQNVKGVTSLTIPNGSNIMSAVTEILRTSTAIAEDIKGGYSYKTIVSTMTDCEGKYHVTVSVRRFVTPKNEVSGIDTSPGRGVVGVPLTLRYGEGPEDFDIFSLVMALGPDAQLSVTEDDTNEGEGQVVFGDREQITLERAANAKFANSFYSGIRGVAGSSNFGLESGSSGAVIDINNSRFVMAQSSLTILGIAGNVDLYSDLCRNPKKVIKGDDDAAILYRFPEFEPMYVNLSIRVKKDGTPHKDTSADQTHFYYNGAYHLAGVTNTIQGSAFVQTLKLLRTDDS